MHEYKFHSYRPRLPGSQLSLRDGPRLPGALRDQPVYAVPTVREAVEKKGEYMNEGMLYEFNQIMLNIGIWIIGWILLGYSGVYGGKLAMRDKKTGIPKIMALCGTGLIVMM